MNYSIVMVGDDICHHGIKGQKWGRRRYQNLDGSLTPAGRKRYGIDDVSRMSDDELRTRLNRMSKERAYKQAISDTIRLEQGSSRAKSALSVAEALTSTAGNVAKASSSFNKYRAGKTDDKEAKANLQQKSVRRGQDAAVLKEAGNLSKNLGKFTGREKKLGDIDLSHLSDDELNTRLSRINMERSYLQMMDGASNRSDGRERAIKIIQDVGTVAASAASVISIAMTVKSIMDARPKKKD